MVAGFKRIIEHIDDLSMQLQDYAQTVEARVAARTEVRVDAVNAQFEVFFTYQVAMNELLARSRQVTEPLPTFPPPPLSQGDA